MSTPLDIAIAAGRKTGESRLVGRGLGFGGEVENLTGMGVFPVRMKKTDLLCAVLQRGSARAQRDLGADQGARALAQRDLGAYQGGRALALGNLGAYHGGRALARGDIGAYQGGRALVQNDLGAYQGGRALALGNLGAYQGMCVAAQNLAAMPQGEWATDFGRVLVRTLTAFLGQILGVLALPGGGVRSLNFNLTH